MTDNIELPPLTEEQLMTGQRIMLQTYARTAILADRARQAPAPVEVSRLAELPEALRVALEDLDSTEPVGATTSAVLEAAQRWYLDGRRGANFERFQADRKRIITLEKSKTKCHGDPGECIFQGGCMYDCGATMASTPASEVPAGLTTCNCRWNGEKLVQQCTLHEAWRDAIRDWSERAKAAEGRLAATPASPATEGEAVAWRDHVEKRLREWRQRFVNKSGDQLALDDFMDERSLDDLLDYVLDEYATCALAAPIEAEAHICVGGDRDARGKVCPACAANDTSRAEAQKAVATVLPGNGFLAEVPEGLPPGTKLYTHPASSASTEAVALDAKEKNALWYEWTNSATMDDWRVLVELTERALAKKNGWRLGGAE